MKMNPNKPIFSRTKRISTKIIIYTIVKRVLVYIYKKREANRAGKRVINVIYKNDEVSRSILFDNYYEYDILNEVIEILNILQIDYHSTCIDVGANIGNHSVFLSQYFEKVLAFEPHPLNHLLLKANTAYYSNIVIYNNACGASNYTGSISTPNQDNMGHSVLLSSDEGQFQTEVLKLDDIISGPVSFIKIDVEGHELEVIKGALNTIKAFKPVIAFEATVFNQSNDCLNYLLDLDYTFIYRVAKNHNIISRLISIPFRGNNYFDIQYLISDSVPDGFHHLILAIDNNHITNI